MKKETTRVRHMVIAAMMLIAAVAGMPAKAQYGQIANQFTSMLSTALSGSARYKGYAEAAYVKGIGRNGGDFASLTTSQGLTYGPHFFMGVGMGVELLSASVDTPWNGAGIPDKGVTRHGCVVPIFSDFRAIVGPQGKPALVLGVQLGCSFLVSDSYIEVNDGYITSSECFYLRPMVGVRVPLSSTNPRLAFNVAAVYRLMTPNYRPWTSGANRAVTLNGFGITAGIEW